MAKVDCDFMNRDIGRLPPACRREAGAATAFRRLTPVYLIVLALALLAGGGPAPGSPTLTPTVGPWETFPGATWAVAAEGALFPGTPIDGSDPERRALDDNSDEAAPDGFCGHGLQIDYPALAFRGCAPNRAYVGRHAFIDLIPDNTGPPSLL